MTCACHEGNADHPVRWIGDTALAAIPLELPQAVFAFHWDRQPVSDLRQTAEF